MRAVSAMTLGAASMKVNYPADLVTFEGVSSSKLSGVIAKAENGVITIGWVNMDTKSTGAVLNENDVLLSLKFVATVAKGSVALTMGDGSEFADANANTISMAKLASNNVEIGAVPSVFELAQNYPNPFNPTTEIRYNIAAAGKVSLTIYNMMGQEVNRLVNGQQEAGFYTVQWNASGMPSGAYVYRLQVDDKFTASKRLTLLK
jgi:Secretion system C-terminal sorting domain